MPDSSVKAGEMGSVGSEGPDSFLCTRNNFLSKAFNGLPFFLSLRPSTAPSHDHNTHHIHIRSCIHTPMCLCEYHTGLWELRARGSEMSSTLWKVPCIFQYSFKISIYLWYNLIPNFLPSEDFLLLSASGLFVYFPCAVLLPPKKGTLATVGSVLCYAVCGLGNGLWLPSPTIPCLPGFFLYLLPSSPLLSHFSPSSSSYLSLDHSTESGDLRPRILLYPFLFSLSPSFPTPNISHNRTKRLCFVHQHICTP